MNSWVMHSQHKQFFKPQKVKNPKNLKECKELDEYKCRVCGSSKDLGSHHIINRSLGGDDSLSNLITLCFKCHRMVHDGKKNLREFLSNIRDSHPPTPWFRWGKSLEALEKRD